MKPTNGNITKIGIGIAITVISAILLYWAVWVSSAVVRAEVREARLCAVEVIVRDMQESVKALGNIRDDMEKQTDALYEIIRKLKEHEEAVDEPPRRR